MGFVLMPRVLENSDFYFLFLAQLMKSVSPV